MRLAQKKLGSKEFLLHQVFDVKVAARLAGIKRIHRKLTCVPDILDPYVGAGSKKQPLNRDEEEADDV